MSQDGLVSVRSALSVQDTISAYRIGAGSKGRNSFRQNRSRRRCRPAGMTLRPTTLIIFGNAKAGTPLMQACQRAGIDLPLKVLVWEDGDGTPWLPYNEPGSPEGTSSARSSHRLSTPCRQCLPRLHNMQQEQVRLNADQGLIHPHGDCQRRPTKVLLPT
jgi:uncharacterized protein (DUF302 family)